MDRKIIVIFLLLGMLLLVSGCGGKNVSPTSSKKEKLPEIQFSWGLSLHTAQLNLPLHREEEFKKRGVYFNILSEDKYELIEDGKPLAIVSFVPNKGAAEVAALMGQGHVDAALCSGTGILSAIDNGTDVKILSPIHSGGMSFVLPVNTPIKGWEGVKKYIADSHQPVVIGYHSPVSGPRILLEYVFREAGFKVTEDPSVLDADVLMVDLKGTNNLIPALISKQVEGWAAPSAYPELAEERGVGHVAMALEEFPPAGAWNNFPCCVYSVREEMLNKYPEIFKALARLLTEACDYAMENKKDTASIFAEVVGIEQGTAERSTIIYTTNPTEDWLAGMRVYVSSLNEIGIFDGRLKGMPFEEVAEKAFEFSYIRDILATR